MAIYYNLNGSTAQTTELIKPDLDYDFTAINISNTHSSNDATIDLFISDPVNVKNYYYIKNVKIPSGASVILNESFNYNIDFGLYLSIGSSDTVDVIIT
tara:strand:- start:620 stop:916 length:297 start_codon:yes stop_codon:yes gene_type:complete